MKRYRFTVSFEVVADDEEQAIDIATDMLGRRREFLIEEIWQQDSDT